MKLTSPRRSNGAIASMRTRPTMTTGRPNLTARITASCRPPGSAQWRLNSCLRSAASDISTVVGENVDLGPSGQVEQGAGRDEVETGLGQLDPVFPPQPDVE